MESLANRKLLDKGYVELLDIMGDDNTVVSAARVSYLGESKGPEKDQKLINFMMRNGHTSPFEHVIFQWRIKCPLFVRSQWHRHRTWSYNEVSRRYTDEDIEFYIPDEWRIQDNKNKQGSMEYSTTIPNDIVKQHIKDSQKLYEDLISMDIAKEMARMILPQNLYTIFYGTVDLKNLFHFIELRADEHAQYEIQVYAKAMEDIIKDYVPWSYGAWREKHGKES